MAKVNHIVGLAAAVMLVGAALVGPAGVAQAAPAALATYQFTSTGWATFGIVLPKGEASGGLKVGSWVTQTDIKNQWPDGSIRYAILTTHVTTTGSYGITQAPAATGSFTPVVPSASLTLSIESAGFGSSWVPWVSNLPSTVSSDMWLNGPLVKEWRVRSVPQSAGVDHPFLDDIWDVRAYNDGTGTVDVTVENVRDVASATGVVYGVDVNVDGHDAYHHDAVSPAPNPISCDQFTCTTTDNPMTTPTYLRLTSGAAAGQVILGGPGSTFGHSVSFTPVDQTNQSWEMVLYHQYGSRWHKVFPTAGFQEAAVVTDFAPFVAAGAIPDYLTTVPDATQSAIDTSPWGNFDLMSYGVIDSYAWATGYRPELYLYPEWAVRYVVNGTPALRAETLAYGDISGNFGDDFAASDPSQIVTLDDNVNYWIDSRSDIGNKPLNNLSGTLNQSNSAHKASLAYIPYLVTGDRYYSDQMMFDANWAIMSNWPFASAPYTRGADGILWATESRATAWAFRDVTDAAFYLPDSNPYKPYFLKVMNANLAHGDAVVATPDNPLGLAIWFALDAGPSMSLWQMTYLAWSFDHAIIQNTATTGTNAVRALIKPAITLLDGAPGFPPEYASAYYFTIGVDPGGGAPVTLFTTWAQVFNATYVSGGVTASPPVWVGYLGPELRIAAILGKKYDIPGAQAALDFVMTQDEATSGALMNDVNQRSALAIADYNRAPLTLVSISVVSPPSKTTYAPGDALSLAGLKVVATYSDGSKVDVTAHVTTNPAAGAMLSKTGKITVRVSYSEDGVTKTATFTVTVSAGAVTPGIGSVPTGGSVATPPGVLALALSALAAALLLGAARRLAGRCSLIRSGGQTTGVG